MRSFRSEHVSAFVKAVLDSDVVNARRLCEELATRYPMALTRDLRCAKQWLRVTLVAPNGTDGGVVESPAIKPHAMNRVRIDVDPGPLVPRREGDTRSSYYLEDAATEFQIEGLELDWIGVTWDADFQSLVRWRFPEFRGKAWAKVSANEKGAREPTALPTECLSGLPDPGPPRHGDLCAHPAIGRIPHADAGRTTTRPTTTWPGLLRRLQPYEPLGAALGPPFWTTLSGFKSPSPSESPHIKLRITET